MFFPFAIVGAFILGVVSVKAPLADVMKCAAKKAIKTGESLKSTISGLQEDVEDAKAEVVEELSQGQNHKTGKQHPAS